ncbi:MAG TPA: hypothetical protein VD969_24940 [Symbiobacteriaceae bacterium]|nr:hypothetical protein [Symbiobacteriaceae bacterium]
MVELSPIRVDAERARAFVLAHGAARDVARLEGIMGSAGPAREVVREIEGLQGADGGFPGGIDVTCYVLHQLKDMPPLSGSPMASRAVAYLRRVQQTDGSWAETNPVYGWQTPPYLTAVATYSILMSEPDHTDPINRGATWLRRFLGSADPATVPVQTLALAWAVFYKLLGPEANETVWAFQAVTAREMDASERAWALACALELAAGGRFALPIVGQLAALAAQQGADGAWPAEPGFALEATLTALRVFRGYGII